jgi:hypothetical protein
VAEGLMAAAGVRAEEARPALTALAAGAVENVGARGPAGALTGPVARGDAETVALHLARLSATTAGAILPASAARRCAWPGRRGWSPAPRSGAAPSGGTGLRLYVNIDHVATVRQARGTDEPDPVRAAVLAELGGADGITVHLREDRRHIQDRDVRLLMETARTPSTWSWPPPPTCSRWPRVAPLAGHAGSRAARGGHHRGRAHLRRGGSKLAGRGGPRG